MSIAESGTLTKFSALRAGLRLSSAGSANRSYAIPFLLFGITSWFAYHANYIADEGYVSLLIARNLAQHGRQTFSDIFPTNGFQPLWQYLLAGYTWQVLQFQPSWIYQSLFAIPLSAVLLALGMRQFQKLAEQLGLSTLWLVYVPAAYLLTFELLYTEAHALYAAVAVLARLSLAPAAPPPAQPARQGKKRGPQPAPAPASTSLLETPAGACYGGLAAAAVFLAQWDSAGLVACWLVWLGATGRAKRWVALGGLVLLIPVIAYLAENFVWFDGLLPISDWLVTCFPAVWLKGFAADGLASTLCGYNVLFGWLPIVVGGAALWWGQTAARECRHFGWVLWAGCLLQLAWIGLFTRPHADSYRHYVLPMILGGFALAVAWPRLFARAGGDAPRLATGNLILALALAGLWVGLTITLRWSAPRAPLAIEAPVDYLGNQAIVGSTLFTSELPGNLAWRTPPNDVVDATFRADYRPLYERIRQSPNALEALQAEYAAVGRPLRAIIYVAGSQCLGPDENLRGVTYYDPRALPERKPIGTLKFPAGPALVTRLNGQLFCVIWDLGRSGKSEGKGDRN